VPGFPARSHGDAGQYSTVSRTLASSLLDSTAWRGYYVY